MNLREYYENTFQHRKNELIIAFCDFLYALFPTRRVDLLRYKANKKSVVDWYDFKRETGR